MESFDTICLYYVIHADIIASIGASDFGGIAGGIGGGAAEPIA
jgi:hypothetical protein